MTIRKRVHDFARSWRQIVEWSCALLVSFLFLRSALAHVGNPYYFLSTVFSYQLLPLGVGEPVGVVFPFLQLAVSCCLLTRTWVREAFLVALILFTLFLVAQLCVLARGLEISCGCFGASERLTIGWQTVLVSGGGAAAAAVGWLCTLSAGPRLPVRPTTKDQ